MALINCPECGKQISSLAKACPNCGCPISSEPQSTSFVIENEKESLFPELPTVMKIGKQITNWGFDAALQDTYFSTEMNHTQYITEGSCNVLAHTNGICIMRGLNFFYLSYKQIISMKYVSHQQLTTENKSVIGRAALGGLLLGPIGAIVGGISGIGSKTKTLGNYLFVINFYDVYTHTVQSLLFVAKNENPRFIQRCEKEKTSNNIPEGDNVVCNVLDSKGHISDEKIIEALKDIGSSKLIQELSRVENMGELGAAQKLKQIGENKQIDLSKYQSSGCLVTLIMLCSSFVGLLTLIFYVI